ncbi:MAG: LytTR family DNA-binding domain-containing protein [Chryseolinea sp.]
MSLNVLIIEDEPLAAERVAKLAKEINADVNVLSIIDSVAASVEWILQNPSPDLILMDIQLADGMSFQIFERCEVTTPVIFITAFDEYAIKAFKVNGIDYILKPVDKGELAIAFKKLKNLVQPKVTQKMMEDMMHAMQSMAKNYRERFVIKVGEHLRTVGTVDVLFFYSHEKATFAQARNARKHILDFTMDQLEEQLDPARFFRINRKYIVSLDAIQDMISHTNSRLKLVLKLSDDNDVIVARERIQEFKDWLEK